MKKFKSNYDIIILLAPSIILLIITTLFPLIYCIWISLNSIIIFYPVPVKFVGFDNFINSLLNPIYGFWTSAYNTLIFTGCSLAIEFILGLGIALLLNKEFKGVWFLRYILVLPLLISPISIGLLFRLMFLPGDWAFVNWILTSLGLGVVQWLANPMLAMIVLIITDVWEWTPFMSLIFLAALQILPPAPFEAASIDGASSLQIFRYLTFPMLKEMMIIAFLLRLMDSLKTFDIIYIITQGGPGTSTQNLNFNAFLQAFTFGNISIAAAQILMLTFIVIFISIYLIRMVRERA